MTATVCPPRAVTARCERQCSAHGMLSPSKPVTATPFIYGTRNSKGMQSSAQVAVQRRRIVTLALPIVPIMTIAYAAGAFKFWSGFNRTTFEDSKKAQLTALWPLLMATSPDFRRNFKRAIDG